MFKWLSKRAPEPDMEEELRGGLFSTEGRRVRLKKLDLGAILAHSFQRTVDYTQTINPDGTAVAMDNDIQEVKLLNNRFNPSIPEAQIGWYASQGFIGYQMCAMLSQNSWIDKACTMPGRDAARNGYEITTEDENIDPKILAYMVKLDKKFGIKKQVVELVKNNRIFGVRVAMFLIDSTDPEYYEKPFNIDGVMPRSYRGISQIDPYWITPELGMEAATNPSSKNFYEPTWWRINGKRVHRSHLVIVKNGEVPDILKPTYMYGGIPVTQKLAERVYAAERTANEAPLLAMTKRLINLKVDMTQAVVDQEEFTSRMQIWTSYMNNFGVKVTGEGEEITQYDTSLADLDDTIMTQFQLVAGIAEIPMTRFLGTSPKGVLSNTGEGEAKDYCQFLESIQEHDMTPLVQRHHDIVMRSEVCPKFGIKPFETNIEWAETDMHTATEQADINLKKAQTGSALAAAGAIDGVDERNRIRLDKQSGYNGISEIVPEMPGQGDDVDSDDDAENPNQA